MSLTERESLQSGEIATVRFGSMARLFQISASIVIERVEILSLVKVDIC